MKPPWSELQNPLPGGAFLPGFPTTSCSSTVFLGKPGWREKSFATPLTTGGLPACISPKMSPRKISRFHACRFQVSAIVFAEYT
jgi:hypothetical protein